MSLPIIAQTDPVISAGGELSIFSIDVVTGVEYPLDCSSGFSSQSPVLLGTSRSWVFRIYNAPSDKPMGPLTVYNIEMESGEQFAAELSGTFPLAITPGSFYEFSVTFAPECFGYFADYINIRTSDSNYQNCRISIDASSEKLRGPQLSAIFSYATEAYPFAFQDETNVLPSAYLPKVPSVEQGDERLVLLNMYNWGVKELEVMDVIWAGPIDPRNDYPINPLNIGGTIPAGGQSFHAAYLTDEADCENNIVTATFITNRYNTCPGIYNSSTFSFEVVFPDENCEDSNNDDFEEGRGFAKGPTMESLGERTVETTFRIYPSVTSTTITIESLKEEMAGNRNYVISNLAGQVVMRGVFTPGVSAKEIVVSKLPIGGYFLLFEGVTQPLRFIRQ